MTNEELHRCNQKERKQEMNNNECLKLIIELLKSRADDRRLLIAVYTLITNM